MNYKKPLAQHLAGLSGLPCISLIAFFLGMILFFLPESAYGQCSSVKIVSKDRLGNYLGSGHPVLVTIFHPEGTKQIQLTDNIGGTCTNESLVTQNILKADARSEIDVDDKTFATVKSSYSKWSVSLHSGTAIPIGTFTYDFGLGLNMLLNASHNLSSRLSVVGLFGYNDFKSKTAGIDDIYWINISANMKYRVLTRTMSPCIGAGLGYYIPKTGSSKIGANIGFSFDYDFNSLITMELGVNYHVILKETVQTVLVSRKPEICDMVYLFFQSHVGLILRF
jgi:hypothetical protein